MSIYTEAPWYDEVMVERGSPAMLPLEESGWLPLYTEAASWVDANADVVDLGCGTGRFCHALVKKEHYGGFVGIDFSQAALDEAARYLADIKTSDLELVRCDLREWQPSPTRAGNATYVSLETMEHLADDGDVDLVRRIPPGHRLIFSVPNYDSEAHVRTFRNAGDLWERYGHLVEFRRWSLIDLGGPRWLVHLVDTVRRGDSW